MIMAFANLVNAVMSPVALIAFEMRLCLADDACNFKVFFLLVRNDLVHSFP